MLNQSWKTESMPAPTDIGLCISYTVQRCFAFTAFVAGHIARTIWDQLDPSHLALMTYKLGILQGCESSHLHLVAVGWAEEGGVKVEVGRLLHSALVLGAGRRQPHNQLQQLCTHEIQSLISD